MRLKLTSLSGLAAILAILVLTSCGRAPKPASDAGGDTWREFRGTWTAVGTRQMMPLTGDRRASIGTFNGSLVLVGQSRLGVGFRADAIVFNDTATGLVGRAVWTDERGDQAFSELRGDGTTITNRIMGTFVGGTGRYAGVTGTYEFSWRFVLENEDGNVQGESIDLSGRVRLGSGTTSSGGGTQS